MIKFIHTFLIKRAILLLIPGLFLGACKRDKVLPNTGKPGKVVTDTGKNKPIINLPDEVMFVGTENPDSNKYTIYLLDAETGQSVTRYDYPDNAHSDFCKPFAGNGLLYDVERNKINAITMNTGTVLWTDSVGMDTDDASIILHDDTFYGITYNHTGTSGGDFAYALNATKKSTSFLWKTPVLLTGNVYNIPITYYNGTIYITNDFRLTALDAKTGTLKWSVTNNSSFYSLASLNIGLITAGHTVIDASSGTTIATATDPAIPLIAPGATQTSSSLDYVTSDLFFVETTQTAGLLRQSFLSAIDRSTGTEKWRADFGGVTSDNTSVTETTKAIRSVWNNKFIVEKNIENTSDRPGASGPPIINYFTAGFSTFDISTGLIEDIAGGESNIAAGLIQNDDRGYFIANNTMYGNYYADSGFGINVYATDLSTGQIKWHSKSLGYSGIFDIFTCVFSISQGKAYSPYINLGPHARQGAKVGLIKFKRHG